MPPGIPMTVFDLISSLWNARRFERWSGELLGLERELRALSGRTEGEFLSIGEGLLEFHRRAGEITDTASSVGLQVSGDDVGAAIAGLRELLDRIEGYLSRSEAEATRVAATLSEIREMLDSIGEPLAGFRKVVRILRILGVSTRIESARLTNEGTGFESVSDHVEKLSTLIEEKSTAVAGQRDALDALITTTLATVLDLQTRQRGRAREILAETRNSISFLTGTHDKCSRVLNAIADRSEGVSRNIAEVVTSMQFHDITRQQIEHVVEAIDELIGDDSAGQGKSGIRPAGGRTRPLAGISDACTLQSAHLAHAREALVDAVGRIMESLRGVGKNVAGMAEETREMAGVIDKAGHSFLSDMEAELGHVTAALTETAASVGDLSRVMRSVTDTVADMARFVGDIEQFGSEIELIALNASIKATRTGNNGASLRVLAESIQRLSLDARKHTTAVSAGLRAIAGGAETLRMASGARAGAAEGAGDDENEDIGRDLKALMGTLRGVNERIESLLRQLDRSARSFSGDIESTVQRLSVHEIASDVLGAVASDLERIGREARPFHRTSDPSGASRMASLSRRYTMEGERDVHRAITGKAISAGPGGTVRMGEAVRPGKKKEPPPAPPPAGGAAAEGALGDNVELF
jgi:methyl-accepting chemotaxis protein